MNTYFALFLIAVFSSLTITPLIRRLCERFNLLDVPLDGRRVHTKAIPRLGGVAVFLSFVIALSTLPFVNNLLTQSLRPLRSELLLILLPATLVLLLGIYDDLRGANATVKFIGLGLIASLFYALGGRIHVFALPPFGSIHLPSTLSFVITVVWLVGIANAFNLIDGMDGLACGAALFSSLVILGVSLAGENPLMIVVTLVISGALVGFLRYNFSPASIFLGDSGALFVGFTLAALSVFGAQKATTAVAVIIPILAFGLPVVDTGVTMARRLISGRPVFQGDREHIHHMLLARGWSQRQVVLVLYGVCAAFGLLATIFTKTSSPLTGLVLFVIGVAVIVALGHLRYHEMTVGQMLEFGEFVYAQAQLGKVGEPEEAERALRMAGKSRATKRAELRGGRISWFWSRDHRDGEEIESSRHYWSVRLPLSTKEADWGWINLYREFDSEPLLVDINYLCDLFRRELSAATERVLHEKEGHTAAAKLSLSASGGKVAG